MGREHMFSDSEVDITQFSLAPDVFHLENACYKSFTEHHYIFIG